MSDSTAIEPVEATRAGMMPVDQRLAMMSDTEFKDSLARIGTILQRRKLFLRAACQACENTDWQNFGGKPYLSGVGADRLLLVLGLRFEEPKFEVKEVGDDFFVDVSGWAEWPEMGVRAHVLGGCNTRDKFFASETEGSQVAQARKLAGDNEALARRMILDKVKKKAHENWKGRAAAQVLGIRGLDWKQLEEFGVMRSGAGAKVDFKKGQAAAKDDSKDAPYLTFVDAMNAAVGSTVATTAIVDRFKARVVNVKDKETGEPVQKTVLDVWLSDPTGSVGESVKGSVWNEAPEWLCDGLSVEIAKMTIGTFKDRVEFKIWQWSASEQP